MRVTIEVHPADIEAIATHLNARAKGECCPAQCEAIADQALTKLVVRSCLEQPSLALTAALEVFERDYEEFSRQYRGRKSQPRGRVHA